MAATCLRKVHSFKFLCFSTSLRLLDHRAVFSISCIYRERHIWIGDESPLRVSNCFCVVASIRWSKIMYGVINRIVTEYEIYGKKLFCFHISKPPSRCRKKVLHFFHQHTYRWAIFFGKKSFFKPWSHSCLEHYHRIA